jgi:divalent metal cation (Fe/Co/Zn/Cd) transporter
VTRAPTGEQRLQERAFLWTSAADTTMTACFVAAAMVSGSLTMLGEAARAALLLALHLYALWSLMALHRGRFVGYEFGVGKIERMVWIVLGLGFLVGAYWVAGRVFAVLASGEVSATPLGLALAAVVNALGVLINFMGWHAMRAALREDSSGVLQAQVHARRIMFQAGLALQGTLTCAALARDPVLVTALDAAGALLLVFYKLVSGVIMIRRGLPDLLDAPAPENLRAEIRAALLRTLPERDVVAIRTRRSGRRVFAEVAVTDNAATSAAELARRAAAVRATLSRRGVAIDLRIVAARTPLGGGA